MSYDCRCDEKGNLEIEVSRWYNVDGGRVETLVASGFHPYEAVQVEVMGLEDSEVPEEELVKIRQWEKS